MKVVVLFRPNGEQARSVNDYIREVTSRYPELIIESIDVDSLKGEKVAQLYDIQRYPAVIVLQEDGSMSKMWQGEEFPLIDEVVSFAIA